MHLPYAEIYLTLNVILSKSTNHLVSLEGWPSSSYPQATSVCFDLKVSPGLAFSKIIKSFKNYYVLGFFENFGSFLVLIQNWQQKRAPILNLLVFKAGKLMNSHNLSQGL